MIELAHYRLACACSVPAGLPVTASMGFDIVTTPQSRLVPDELDDTLTEDTGRTVALSVPSTDGGTSFMTASGRYASSPSDFASPPTVTPYPESHMSKYIGLDRLCLCSYASHCPRAG